MQGCATLPGGCQQEYQAIGAVFARQRANEAFALYPSRYCSRQCPVGAATMLPPCHLPVAAPGQEALQRCMRTVTAVAKRPERQALRTNTNGFDAAALRLDTPHAHLLHRYPMSQELGDVRGQCRNVGMTPRCTPDIQHELFELIHCSYPSNTIVIPLYLIVNSILFNRKFLISRPFSE